MTLLWILIGIALLAIVVARLIDTVRTDGYGSNQPPQSHEAWFVGGPDSYRRTGF
ncbi:hypothetical protein [Pengzhenrongella frigida]|uniref:hypothetical protein n=1 Tax=Pengzhenrongella frigida TaxID=1259133 RepID=UPI0013ECE6FB|nr:hypothetical protein [Cellulomonas sp. HLT2-17]